MDSSHAPIYSSYEGDPELQEALCDFVVGLAEEVDLLQDAEASGDLERLEALSRDLGQRAQTFGYEALGRAADQVCEACREKKPESAQTALVELTDIGRRIRRGHRGSC